MKPLPERITDAFAALDEDMLRLLETYDLKGARQHQQKLTQLLAEMAPVMKAARNDELTTNAMRRWDQAVRLLDHKTTGMTVKEAEEEARLDVKEKMLKEMDADANMVGLEVLQRALIEKIRLAQDVANDIKHFQKGEGSY